MDSILRFQNPMHRYKVEVFGMACEGGSASQSEQKIMPTVLRDGPYRFYFLSGDRVEPPHIHVRRDNGFAKFWLNPVTLQDSGNFGNKELRRIRRIIEQNQATFLEVWDDYFDH